MPISTGVCRGLSKGDRQERRDQAVAWRLGLAGARRDRRLQADVVTLALAYDIDAIAGKGFWTRTGEAPAAESSPIPRRSCFWFQRAIPRHQDWDDLIKPGVRSSRRTENLGRCTLELPRRLGLCREKLGSPDKTKKFGDLLRTCGTGYRARPTVTFVERGVGDVLLAWENEAFLAQREFGKDKFEIIAPPLSILAEPPVAIVDRVTDKKATREAAEAYLKYWYTKEGQEIAARNSYRPRDPQIAKDYEKSFAKVELFTIDDVFGGWTKAQKEHFGEGGIFDQIYKN
jgi:sulfate transport system substrate-binding protein